MVECTCKYCKTVFPTAVDYWHHLEAAHPIELDRSLTGLYNLLDIPEFDKICTQGQCPLPIFLIRTRDYPVLHCENRRGDTCRLQESMKAAKKCIGDGKNE